MYNNMYDNIMYNNIRIKYLTLIERHIKFMVAYFI